jgi:hypothetical protein
MIAAAQALLVANSATGTQNVIVLLSDGNASATQAQMYGSTFSTYGNTQCTEAVAADKAATTAGTWVYSIAYGAPSSGCMPGDLNKYTPCTAMQAIASDTTKFYTTSSTCSLGASQTNPTNTAVSSIFLQIAYSLQKARLIPNI